METIMENATVLFIVYTTLMACVRGCMHLHLQTALPKVVLHRRKQLVMSVCKPEAICIIICTTYIYSILAMKITQYLRRQINIS